MLDSNHVVTTFIISSTNVGDNSDDQKRFVCRVFLIVAIQLHFITAINITLNANETCREWFYDRAWIYWCMLGVSVVLYLLLACIQLIRDSYPYNMLMLVSMTLSVAFFVSGLTASNEAPVVCLGFMSTGLTALGICFLVKFCPMDVTGASLLLTTSLISFIIFVMTTFVFLKFVEIEMIHLLICVVIVISISYLLIYFIQLLVNGRIGEINSRDYVLGTILLYISFSGVFLYCSSLVKDCFSV